MKNLDQVREFILLSMSLSDHCHFQSFLIGVDRLRAKKKLGIVSTRYRNANLCVYSHAIFIYLKALLLLSLL